MPMLAYWGIFNLIFQKVFLEAWLLCTGSPQWLLVCPPTIPSPCWRKWLKPDPSYCLLDPWQQRSWLPFFHEAESPTEPRGSATIPLKPFLFFNLLLSQVARVLSACTLQCSITVPEAACWYLVSSPCVILILPLLNHRDILSSTERLSDL